jgi:uncharacterized protein (TIGR00369 family)
MEADEVAYRASYDEHEATGRTPPLHHRMGLKLVQLSPTTVMTMELGEEVRGFANGSVHGGMLATFADVASAVALWRSFDHVSEIPITTDMHMRYYRQPGLGPLTAEATVVHAGRRLLSTECSVTDGGGRLLARSTATYMLARRPLAGAPAPPDTTIAATQMQ